MMRENRVAVGVLLAGGLSARMGHKEKCFLKLGKQTILSHIIQRCSPQTPILIINANGDPLRFNEYKLPVVADGAFENSGPLAGIYAGMKWATENNIDTQYIATFATDTPFIPDNFVELCNRALEETGRPIALARSNGRTHPVLGVFSIKLIDDLEETLNTTTIKKVESWTSKHEPVEVSFEVCGYDPFFNINTPEELELASQIYSATQNELDE